MKKWICMLLVLLMLPLAGLAAEQAQEKNVDIPLVLQEGMHSESLIGVLTLGGTLYTWTFDGLYALREKDNKLELVASTKLEQPADQEGEDAAEDKNSMEILHLTVFLSDGQNLYGFSSETADLYPLTIQDQQLVPGTPLHLGSEDRKSSYTDSEGGEHTYYRSFENMALHGGRVYGMVQPENGNESAQLYSFDLATGEEMKHEVEHLRGFTPYKDGKFLVLTLDSENAWDNVTNTMRSPMLLMLDPSDNRLTEMGLLGNNSFARYGSSLLYDAANDRILYTVPNAVIRRMADGTEEKCAYLPFGDSWGGSGSIAALLGDGRFAIVQEGTLYLRSTDPKDLPSKSLLIYGSWEDEAHKNALVSMPDTSVSILQNKWFSSAQELGQAMIGGEDGIDILSLESAWMDLQNLMQKGYAADLSSYPFVQQYMDSLYPFLKDMCMQDGKIYGVPIRLNITPIGFNVPVLEKLGLKVPTTFAELCDLVKTWQEQHTDNGEYLLVNQPESNWLMGILMQTYMNHCVATGQEINLDTPLFREMMAQMQTVPASFYHQEKLDYEDMAAMNEFFNKPSLIYIGYGFDLRSRTYEMMGQRNDAPTIYNNLKATADGPAPLAVTATLLMVNSKSKDVENAVRYLENYLRSMPAHESLMLLPGQNEPVEDKDYERRLTNIEDRLERMKKALEKAEGADKTQLEESLKTNQEEYETYKENGKYSISKEVIEDYRRLMEGAYGLTFGNNRLFRLNEFHELRSRLEEGQVSLDQFISEVDAKLRLIRLEQQ